MPIPIIGVLSSILGGGDVVSKGMDLIDDMWETDAEARESKTEAKIKLMNSYAPFKVAQRWIAIMFTINFIAVFWAGLGFWAFGEAARLGEFIDILKAFNIGWIMFAIITFYFGGGLTESVGRSFISKPGESKKEKE